jgi:hypothetical protein
VQGANAPVSSLHSNPETTLASVPLNSNVADFDFVLPLGPLAIVVSGAPASPASGSGSGGGAGQFAGERRRSALSKRSAITNAPIANVESGTSDPTPAISCHSAARSAGPEAEDRREASECFSGPSVRKRRW